MENIGTTRKSVRPSLVKVTKDSHSLDTYFNLVGSANISKSIHLAQFIAKKNNIKWRLIQPTTQDGSPCIMQ